MLGAELPRRSTRSLHWDSVCAEHDGSAVVEHSGGVNVGEKVVGTGEIEVSGARNLYRRTPSIG